MADRLVIARASLADAAALAPLMRAEDAAEVYACSRMEPLEALTVAVNESARAWSGFIDGEIAAMWGVVPENILGGLGVPWLLTGRAVERYRRVLLLVAPKILAEMLIEWPMLHNIVDARYGRALRWASRVGFTLSEPLPVGYGGEPFHLASMRL